MEKRCSRWFPTPGQLASYIGKTRAKNRNVTVIAEGRGGYMVVDAIGKKG